MKDETEHVYTIAPVAGPILPRAEIVGRIRRAVIAHPEQFGLADFGIVAPLASVLEFVCDDTAKLGTVWASLVEHGLASGWRDNGGEPFMAIAGIGNFGPGICNRLHDFTGTSVAEIVVRRRAA